MVRPPPRPEGGSGPVHGDLMLTVVDDVPVARLLLVGELDLAAAPGLGRFLDGLVADGHRRIDLDLSQLEFLGAAGLTVFCVTADRLRQRGGRLRLTAPPAGVRRILQITGLDDLLAQPVAGPASRSGSVAPAPASAYGGDRSDRVATSTINV